MMGHFTHRIPSVGKLRLKGGEIWGPFHYTWPGQNTFLLLTRLMGFLRRIWPSSWFSQEICPLSGKSAPTAPWRFFSKKNTSFCGGSGSCFLHRIIKINKTPDKDTARFKASITFEIWWKILSGTVVTHYRGGSRVSFQKLQDLCREVPLASVSTGLLQAYIPPQGTVKLRNI